MSDTSNPPPEWVDFDAHGTRYSHVGGVKIDGLMREFDEAVEIIEQAVEEGGWQVEGEPLNTIGSLVAATCSYVIEMMREETEKMVYGKQD